MKYSQLLHVLIAPMIRQFSRTRLNPEYGDYCALERVREQGEIYGHTVAAEYYHLIMRQEPRGPRKGAKEVLGAVVMWWWMLEDYHQACTTWTNRVDQVGIQEAGGMSRLLEEEWDDLLWNKGETSDKLRKIGRLMALIGAYGVAEGDHRPQAQTRRLSRYKGELEQALF